MKNCLLYTSCLQRGGTERIVCVYAECLQKKGCHTTVLTNFRMEGEYPLPEGAKRIVIGERIHETSSRIHNYLERLRVIRNACRENEIEVAVVFARANAIRMRLATLGLKTKVVISIRTNPEAEFGPGLSSLIAKKIFALADSFLFQTEQQRDFFGARIAARSVVVPNSIDKSFRQNEYTGERDNRIVTAGRLIPCKNHKMLMRAFAGVAAEFPETELWIYGEGSCREELKNEIDRLGMQERIYLPGAVNNLAEVIKSAGLFVLSSDYEGMPNALLEAMALGIPSIATDCPCGGPAEIIQDGENGLLVPVGDVKRLEEAMRRMLGDEKFCRRVGAAGTKVREDYSEEKTFDRLYRYLEKVRER